MIEGFFFHFEIFSIFQYVLKNFIPKNIPNNTFLRHIFIRNVKVYSNIIDPFILL